MIIQQYSGEIAAIATAFCWAITATAFERGAKKIGSMNLNLLRLILGLVFLSVFTLITRGTLFPTDASSSTWFWLLLSGLVGLVVGDLLLMESFVRIGSRTAMLIYSSVPPITALLSFIFLGEEMSGLQIVGMFVTLLGIGSVILVADKNKKVAFAHPLAGILFAFGGAVGQSAGYIIGKFGMADYNPFSATQIRLIAGIFGFSVIFTVTRQWPKLKNSFHDVKALTSLTIGSLFGPFIGISLSLYAVQRINPGVASTLTSITPILMIPYAVLVLKEKVSAKEILGTLLALTGVGIMFL